jgi:putative transcriptional regulator
MTDDLETPTLLLAMPQVQDPFFERSVVLLMSHGEQGSLGVVINRPAGLTVHDILDDLEIRWSGPPESTAFIGGPVMPEVGTLLYAFSEGDNCPPEGILSGAPVMPGLSMTQNLGDLEQLAAEPPRKLRFVLGHAGWGAGQLLTEVLRNDWLAVPVDLDLIFHPKPETVWEAGLRSVGLDPRSLASVSASSGLTN